MISQSLKALLERVEELHRHAEREVCEIMRVLDAAGKAWPDHQIVPAKWFRRGEATPPVGEVWYSDGIRVWMVHSDGNGMGGHPDVCRFWTHAWIPAAPVGMDLEMAAEPTPPALPR
jgi:hypothetical protein